MQADITLLRQQVEALTARSTALREIATVTEKALQQVYKESQDVGTRYRNAVDSAFEKAFPHAIEAIERLSVAQENLTSEAGVVATMTEYTHLEVSAAEELDQLYSGPLGADSILKIDRALNSIEMKLVKNGADADVARVAKAIFEARSALTRAHRRLSKRKKVWKLISEITELTTNAIVESEKARAEIGYQLVVKSERRGKRKE